jgi:hypothetical protein
VPVGKRPDLPVCGGRRQAARTYRFLRAPRLSTRAPAKHETPACAIHVTKFVRFARASTQTLLGPSSPSGFSPSTEPHLPSDPLVAPRHGACGGALISRSARSGRFPERRAG